MAVPYNILDKIRLAKEFYSNLNVQYIDSFKSGCVSEPKNFRCIGDIIVSLDFKIELDEYDDIFEDLFTRLQDIIGGYYFSDLFIADGIDGIIDSDNGFGILIK